MKISIEILQDMHVEGGGAQEATCTVFRHGCVKKSIGIVIKNFL